ncbi:MAG: TolC family protein [Pseudomonadota bacterium]|nr:TolC family protein [Pseudomonadota bacterium]
MNKLPIFLVCITSSCIFSYDLTQVLNLSREHDPGYQSKILEFSASEKAAAIALGKSLPSLTMSLTGSQASNNASVTSNTSKLKFSSTIPLYNPEIIHRRQAGKLATDSARLSARSFQSAHTLGIAESYFATLSAQASYETKITAVNHYKKSYEESLALEKAGLKTHVDTLISLAAYDNGRLEVLAAKNELQHALSQLEGKIDSPIGTLNTYKKTKLPLLSVEPLEDLIIHALSRGSKIQKAQLSLEKAREGLSHAESKFLPSVSMTVGISQKLGQLHEGLLNRDHSIIESSIALSMNLFNGLSDYNLVKQKFLSFQSSQENLKNETYNIKLDIEKRYRDFSNAKLKVNVSLTAMESARISLEAISEQHVAGTVSELELLAAITRNTSAQQSYYSAIYNYFMSYLRLKASASLLNDNAIDDINQFLQLETALMTVNDLS